MGETTQGRTGKWAKRPGGETTRGERESGRNDSGANGKVGETTRILNFFLIDKMHSCETQLTTAINDWDKILDNGGQVDTFILDFETAFDTPPHELLKSKLFGCGIGGKTLKWIDSFLCYRQQ